MIRNIHPADELSLIHEDLRRLKAREAFLQRGFLGDTLPRVGVAAVVEVDIIKNRKFLHDRLPAAILNDATYWEDRRSKHVRVRLR
jgi:hypothetical protein